MVTVAERDVQKALDVSEAARDAVSEIQLAFEELSDGLATLIESTKVDLRSCDKRLPVTKELSGFIDSLQNMRKDVNGLIKESRSHLRVLDKECHKRAKELNSFWDPHL